MLVRDLRHPPEKVWRALTQAEHLREWAPFDIEGDLETVGSTVKLTWVGTPVATDTKVLRVEAPRLLEFGDIRWELEQVASGNAAAVLWATIDRRFISMGAAGWHISLDVLEALFGRRADRPDCRSGRRCDPKVGNG